MIFHPKNSTLIKVTFLLIAGIVLWCIEGKAQKGKTKDPVTVSILPYNKKARFNKKFPVKYKIQFVNNLKDPQEGTLVYTVLDNSNQEVLINSLDVKVNAKKTLVSNFEVPIVKEGNYTIKMTVELTNFNSSYDGSFAYIGPPRKSKDRKPEINQEPIVNTPPLSWSKDNLSGDASRQALNAEEVKDAPATEEYPEEEGEMIIKLKPFKKDGVFYDGEKIKYSVSIANKYKVRQDGTFTAIVETELGETVSSTQVKLKIAKKGQKNFQIEIPKPKKEGVYNLRAATNTSTYDDTAQYAFGYNIGKIKTPYYLPPDFDEYWQNGLSELAKVDPQYKISRDEEHSTKYHDVYRVEMKGIDEFPFYGYLSIPKLKGKYPVIIGFGGYKKEVMPLLFDEYISFSVNVRGIDKKHEKEFNPDNIEQIMLKVEDKDAYVYKGIYLDCIRAVEFVYAHGHMGMDLNRVLAFGGSQGATMGLVTAALMPDKINAVIASNPVFADWKNSFAVGKNKRELAFPSDAIVRYLRENPDFTEEQMLETFNYFDLQNFMPKVKCPVLYAVGLQDEFIAPGSAIAAYNKLPYDALSKSELFIFPDLGHEIPVYHNSFIGIWFNEKSVSKKKR
ncbi:acetylxylan esterase [Sediminibacterium sp.]|uniref:acetylxylan esterase n=1 Tax=Sediminibacterium sp. TaxID=1917865 RepID=UPI002733F2C4|nr:acetylxylan esterase [Sediminibacterium sp.]MDP3394640.1 acetylxylan esterase [Sediminibacterium sp.]MDP3568475.1 acetylxylan esterase [Sediminibacterium sp.]